MTARPPATAMPDGPASAEPLIACVGAAPCSVVGARLVVVPSVDALAELPELPSVVVLSEGPGVTVDDCLMNAALPALATIAVVVRAQQWTESLSWRGAQAGAFCCVPSSLSGESLASALLAAASEASRRRLRLVPTSDLRHVHRLLSQARFRVVSLQDAETLSVVIASAMPSPERRLGGVLELLVNAVEHGSFEISFDEKRRLLLSGALHAEFARRAQLAPWAARSVQVDLERVGGAMRLTIADEGPGFDFRAVMERTPDLTAMHGRGIFLARAMSFDRVRYEGRGNVVVAEVDVS